MFSLTQEERKVVLFLLTTALIGLGTSFLIKINSPLKCMVLPNDTMVKIDINKANLEDLLALQNISPLLAKKIIEYRNLQGPFRNLEELKEVKGIGEVRYHKLKDLFYIQ